MKFPLGGVTSTHVPFQRNNGAPMWESLQVLIPLTTEGDQTAEHHALAFRLLPSDAATGINIGVIVASLSKVRITDIASRRSQTDPQLNWQQIEIVCRQNGTLENNDYPC